MEHIKKQLDFQQRVNKSVEAIIHHFREVSTYSDHIEQMAKAQTVIMLLMENYNQSIMRDTYQDAILTGDITTFIWEVSQVYELLKPFADMIGQVYGNEDANI